MVVSVVVMSFMGVFEGLEGGQSTACSQGETSQSFDGVDRTTGLKVLNASNGR